MLKRPFFEHLLCCLFLLSLWGPFKSFHANPSGPGFMRDGTTKSRAPTDRIIESNLIGWKIPWYSLCLPNKAACLGRDMGTPPALHGDPGRNPANQLRYMSIMDVLCMKPGPQNSAFLHLFSLSVLRFQPSCSALYCPKCRCDEIIERVCVYIMYTI